VATIIAVQIASVAAAALIAATAAFQLALAMGAPYGDAVFGGNAPTRSGVLTAPFRALAVVQAIVLVLVGWVLLARAETMDIPLLGAGSLVWVTWAVVVFLILNTANLAAPHPIERWGAGSVTLALSGLGLFIALRAPSGL
jgi:hypothetical protein